MNFNLIAVLAVVGALVVGLGINEKRSLLGIVDWPQEIVRNAACKGRCSTTYFSACLCQILKVRRVIFWNG